MKKVLAVLLLSLAPLAAFSEAVPEGQIPSFTIQWEPPVARVNGESIDPVTEIQEYDLRCYEVDVPGIFYNVTIPGLSSEGSFSIRKEDLLNGYGSYNCELAAIDTDGLYSDYAQMQNGPLIWQASPPGAPTNLILVF